MNIMEWQNRKVPEYYPYMYLDGFTPDEIMYAAQKKMLADYQKRQEENEEADLPTTIILKVK